MIAPDAHGISHGLVLPRNFVRNSCFYRLAPPHELPFSEHRSAAAFGHSSVALMLLLRRSLASCWSFSMCLSGKYGTTVTRVTLLPGAFRLWYESPQRLVASPRIPRKKKKNKPFVVRALIESWLSDRVSQEKTQPAGTNTHNFQR